ncbi:MAG TPA: SMP-30/gluconolactonase/LRE family protein, partial [Opitutus sp.]|nr:SMP-30/gluconolactonase/LRE family protein [Opitutus sp.]
MTSSIQVALRVKASLGESPLWDARANRLRWVDIVAKSVGEFDPSTGLNRSVSLETPVSAVAPTHEGALVVAVQEGIARLDPVTGQLSNLWTPPGHDASTMRFNDGKCDTAGRFIAGTMSLTGAGGAASLYSFSPDGSMRTLLRGVSLSNGLDWNAEGTRMYYVDTPTRQIAVFDYDLASGDLLNRRVAVEIPASLGYPDGLTVDVEGMLWLALWGGGALTRWDPRTGRLLARHSLPVSQVTSCAFGGANL